MRQIKVILHSVFGELNVEATVFEQSVIKAVAEYVECAGTEAKDNVEREIRSQKFAEYKDSAVVVAKEDEQKDITFKLGGVLTRDLIKIAENNKAEDERHQVPIDSITVHSIHLFDGGTPMVRVRYLFDDVCHGGGGRYLWGSTYRMIEHTNDKFGIHRAFHADVFFDSGLVIPW